MSDFHETLNKWCSCHYKANYKQIFQKYWTVGSYRWLRVNDKNLNFSFCPILMKLRTNNYLAILKQNINKFFKKYEGFARYMWLQVIDGKNVNFSILSDFDETQNKWRSCHFKAKYKQDFHNFWRVCLLQVLTCDWRKKSPFFNCVQF